VANQRCSKRVEGGRVVGACPHARRRVAHHNRAFCALRAALELALEVQSAFAPAKREMAREEEKRNKSSPHERKEDYDELLTQ
jgi:hypothetical protein